MWHRSLALRSLSLAGLLAAPACSHWQTQHVSPEQGFAARIPPAVRLTLTDNSQVELERPVLSDSMLAGFSHDMPARIPVSRIAAWSVRRPGSSSDVKLLAAGAGLAALIWMVTWRPFGD